jgi:hypothetical protein
MRSKSAAGEGSIPLIPLGSLPGGDTLSPTLSRKRERGRLFPWLQFQEVRRCLQAAACGVPLIASSMKAAMSRMLMTETRL